MRRVFRYVTTVSAVVTAGLIGSLPSATAQDPASTWCADRSRITVLGASSETGYGTTGYDSPDNGYWPTRHGWVARLARDARTRWGTVTDVHAKNGSTITDFLPGGRWRATTAAVDRIRATQPDLVIIGGTLVNEYVKNIDPATAERNLRTLIGDIRGARPGVDILIITYPDIKWPSARRPWSEYAAINSRVAAELRTALVDLRRYIDDPYSDTDGLWAEDNAHLNDAGQAVEGQVWTLLSAWAGRC